MEYTTASFIKHFDRSQAAFDSSLADQYDEIEKQKALILLNDDWDDIIRRCNKRGARHRDLGGIATTPQACEGFRKHTKDFSKLEHRKQQDRLDQYTVHLNRLSVQDKARSSTDELATYEGQVTGLLFIEPPSEALSRAKRASSTCCPEQLIYWTDASAPGVEDRFSGSGIAIIHDGPVNQGETAYYVPNVRGTVTAELMAVVEALSAAEAEADTTHHIEITKIFTDCKSLLEIFRNPSKTKDEQLIILTHRAFILTNSLRGKGVQVQFHWVPGHSGVEGNSRADKLARWARKHPEASSHKALKP